MCEEPYGRVESPNKSMLPHGKGWNYVALCFTKREQLADNGQKLIQIKQFRWPKSKPSSSNTNTAGHTFPREMEISRSSKLQRS